MEPLKTEDIMKNKVPKENNANTNYPGRFLNLNCLNGKDYVVVFGIIFIAFLTLILSGIYIGTRLNNKLTIEQAKMVENKYQTKDEAIMSLANENLKLKEENVRLNEQYKKLATTKTIELIEQLNKAISQAMKKENLNKAYLEMEKTFKNFNVRDFKTIKP